MVDQLTRMNNLLTWILVLLGWVALIWTAMAIVRIYQFRKSILVDAWRDYANDMYTKGKFDELLKESSRRLEKEPKNVNHMYWKVQALKGLEREEELEEAIAVLLDEIPDWKEDWMDPYIEKKW